jgi:hypothetical protein
MMLASQTGDLLMNKTPFEEGVAAATDGSPSSANPYPAGSKESASWNDGYHSLVDHDEDSNLPNAPDGD